MSDPQPTKIFVLPWCGALLALALGLLINIAGVCPVQAAEASPETVRIGVFLQDLGDLDPSRKSFTASLWLWAINNEAPESPLDRLEFPNAIKIESPYNFREVTEKGVWSQRKIVGSFRHQWDVRRFPFDQQLLRIELEEIEHDSQSILFQADTMDSGVDDDLTLKGWNIRSIQLKDRVKRYPTSFGNPLLPPRTPSGYARAELQIVLQRTDYTGFWKLTVGAFAAAAMAFASHWLHVDDQPSPINARFNLLAGSAFAAVISLRSSANEMGAGGYGTLIDAIHASILLYIVVLTGSSVIIWRLSLRRTNPGNSRRLERRVVVASTIALVVTSVILILGYAV